MKHKIHVHFHGSVFPTKWKNNSRLVKMRAIFYSICISYGVIRLSREKVVRDKLARLALCVALTKETGSTWFHFQANFPLHNTAFSEAKLLIYLFLLSSRTYIFVSQAEVAAIDPVDNKFVGNVLCPQLLL